MRTLRSSAALFLFCLGPLLLSSCAYNGMGYEEQREARGAVPPGPPPDYSARLPHSLTIREKVILVDPNVHAWGAYSDGTLVRAGLVTAGGNWCGDIRRPCRTKAGSFRINSLGSPNCKSTRYPLPRGGAPMPYCMFFNGNQALHGSYEVVEGNVSHGCVRLKVTDAEWLRYEFARVGTKVVVRSY